MRALSFLRPPLAQRDADSAPTWQWFWPVLAAGLALRLVGAVGGDWVMRPDALMQYLEQAHRLVFGYGFVPWEFRYGARTWLIPAIPAAPLWLAKTLGWESPAIYIPLVNSWNALLSMAIPLGMFFYCRRMAGETAARWALMFGCFWHEFIVFAPQALAECYSAACIFAAVALVFGDWKQRRRLLLPAGFLLGLALAIRPHYAPVIAIVGMLWLATLPRRLWIFPLAGGAGGLLFWGLVDYLTWGGWWSSTPAYVEFNNISFAVKQKPFYLNLAALLIASAGLAAAIVFLSLMNWRRHVPLLLMSAAVLATHTNSLHQEYTNIFILLPILWMLAACLVAQWREKRRAIQCFAAAAILASGLGLTNKLPHLWHVLGGSETASPLFYKNPDYARAMLAGEILRKEKTAAIFWDVARFGQGMGGYYHLHHKAPVYFSGDALHLRRIEESGRPTHALFSHIVSARSPSPEGFAPQVLSDFFIYRNKNMSQVAPLPDYALDVHDNFYVNLIEKPAKEAGISLPDAPLTLLK